jgi:hypothetical protein
MLKVTKVDTNRVDLTLSGSIDADEMRKGLDEILALSEGVQNGQMLYRITDFAFPSLEAIGVEFARLPKLFSLLGRFDRCAVVTDTDWLRTAAEFEGMLFPGITIKGFALDEAEKAEAWLEQEPSFPL